MPRLGSKKTRSGCLQCKARRVKCDESRPCGACARYRVECSLLGSANRTPSRSDTNSPRDVQTPVADSPATKSTPGHEQSTDATSNMTPRTEQCPSSMPDSIPRADWAQDLELMHHYTAHAHQTLPGTAHIKQIWGFAVPQEAFKYPFLLHSILAFSSNHLAYINPSKAPYFRFAASAHQTAALTTLNKAVADIGPSNCHSIFVAASLTVINAFADARAYDLDVLIETFQLVRGMDYVLENVTDMLKKGPFAAIVRPIEDPPKPSPMLSAFLVEISTMCCNTHTNPSPSDLVVAGAIEKLRNGLQYGLETSLHPALRAVMIWPISIESEFIDILKERTNPEVRKILKHYCRVLEHASTDFWFLVSWRGISQQL